MGSINMLTNLQLFIWGRPPRSETIEAVFLYRLSIMLHLEGMKERRKCWDFHGNKEARSSNKSNRQRYNWNPVWISTTKNHSRFIEWILILCTSAHWSRKRWDDILDGVSCLFVLVFIYFHFNTGTGLISKNSTVNTAGNPRGYFEILL